MISIKYLVLLVGLFLIALTDSKEKRIPNEILIVLLVARVVLLVIEYGLYQNAWKALSISAAVGFLCGGGLFLLCYLIAKGAIGAGDVKLFAVLGYYLGYELIFLTAFLSVVYAALYGIWILMMKKADLKREVAFSPFVLLGTITVMILKIKCFF